MATDERGLHLSTDSTDAADAFNAAIRSFFAWRSDAMQHLGAALEADPGFVLAHALRGLFLCGMRQPAAYPIARESLAAARQGEAGCSDRERAYVAALEATLDGDLFRAVSCLEEVIAAHPLDLIAIRLGQMELFWLGEVAWARDITRRPAAAWSEEVPGYSAFLGVRSFALEETGDYEAAERLGRRSIELDPGDCQAAHAVAHVLEMEGRLDDGVEWLDGLKDSWAEANHIVHHLWWHRCLFESERGNHAGAMETYDRFVRNPDSPLIQAMSNFFTDMQNCAALLARLEMRGIDVGGRWPAVADDYESWIGNHTSPLTSPHCALVFAATGRDAKLDELMAGLREFAATDRGTLGPRFAVAVIPAAEAAVAFQRGDYRGVLDCLLPARRLLWQMGGSHAQRDLFFQIMAYAAAQLGRADLLAILLDDVRSIGFAQVDQRASYADIAAA